MFSCIALAEVYWKSITVVKILDKFLMAPDSPVFIEFNKNCQLSNIFCEDIRLTGN